MSVSLVSSFPDQPRRCDRRAAVRQKKQQYETQAAEDALDSRADIEIARLRAVGRITGVAMTEAARITTGERFCAYVAPGSAGRVQAIADSATMTIIGMVEDLPRRLR